MPVLPGDMVVVRMPEESQVDNGWKASPEVSMILIPARLHESPDAHYSFHQMPTVVVFD